MSCTSVHPHPVLPYDGDQAWAILNSALDPDERRSRLFAVLREYDRTAERGNIERIAAAVREGGELLIFGRMSRAFLNQGLLFANATWITPRPGNWPRPPEPQDVPQGEVERALSALRLLLANGKPIPVTQWTGVLDHFENAVLDAQHAHLSAALAPLRVQFENLAGRSGGSPPGGLDLAPVAEQTIGLLRWAQELRACLLEAERHPAAYVVIGQRPSPTGSHLLIQLNAGLDPYPGKPENLAALLPFVRERLYASPDYGWLETADHWIEAIPLFIREETSREHGKDSTRTAVDIAGLEQSFREQMADHWAVSLRAVLDSEMLALARQVVAGEPVELDEEALRLQLIADQADPCEIAALALVFRAAYRRSASDLQDRIAEEEREPYLVARPLLLASKQFQQARDLFAVAGSWHQAATAVLQDPDFEERLERLAPRALQRRRSLPALHVLTTQSAGMTNAFIRTWLEESMALYNLVEDRGLSGQVEDCLRCHALRLHAVSARVIQEFGLWTEVEELRAEGAIAEHVAIQRIVDRHPAVGQEVACLGTLLELYRPPAAADEPSEIADPPSVQDILQQEFQSLLPVALERVLDRNAQILGRAAEALRLRAADLDDWNALQRTIDQDEDMYHDLETSLKCLARSRLLERLDSAHPDWQVQDHCRTFLRRYRDLAITTARKEVIAARGLEPLLSDPCYWFSATGGAKRYHLVYSPSRVDLGPRERESVETWSQWIGGADQAAVRAGRQLYRLINKDVQAFDSLEEPEVLKTGENAAMASHYAYANALALMVGATRRGDVEEMADQMNRRLDRRVHPAGEGYGGYCVPKDGLFLEYVLSLGRDEILHQLGWSAPGQPQHVALARQDAERAQAVDQPARIGEAVAAFGRPEPRDPERIAARLAARWGLHKMVTGGEQVNRFMPVFKSWLIRRALAEAARRAPGVNPIARAVVVLTAEYKPDTSDGRFSTGLRKFEILAGFGEHLLSALDSDGQLLALLISHGYAELEQRGRAGEVLDWLEIPPREADIAGRLRHLFPTAEPPAEIRMVSPTGLSALDLLHYTSDTRLAAIAEEVRFELAGLGLRPADIEANLRAHGPRLERWDIHEQIPHAAWIAARGSIGGRIHALSLAELGPERDYRRALQGADVLDTGVPHRVLLDLLADPGSLCRLMLTGNPHSALSIVDGAAGARPRAMNRLDVMLWFAAGERVGREPVYQAVGLGADTIESWRSTMRRRRHNAERLLTALDEGQITEIRGIYREILAELRDDDAAWSSLSEAARNDRSGRLRARDQDYAAALVRTLECGESGSPDFQGFLAVGGMFLLAGADGTEIEQCRSRFRRGLQRLGWTPAEPPGDSLLLVPTVPARATIEPPPSRHSEGSNKAIEDNPAVALELQRQTEQRLARARTLCERYAAFEQTIPPEGDFASCYTAAMAALGDDCPPLAEPSLGRFIRHTRAALSTMVRDFAAPPDQAAVLARIDRLCCGRRIEPETWHAIAGGYEDIGDFGRLAQRLAEQQLDGAIDPNAAQQGLERIAQGIELFEILLAVESMQTSLGKASTDPRPLWRSLAEFFAHTLNDHTYEYRPWLYSRGTGFAALNGAALYELAAARHAWLYRYLRSIVTRQTEVAELPVDEQDLLLGNFLDGRTVEGIGAEADEPNERVWRAYGQLREIAFLRNDGFPLPVVFPTFDPALIADGERVNHVVAVPVGRTHYSAMLREGPTLTRELEQAGRPGANLIISRKVCFEPPPATGRSTVWVGSGHFYLDVDTYRAALVRYQPGTEADEMDAKGIRVAVRFTKPVQAALVYPFHGDPAYTSGALEDAGLPYTVQSLFHTWTTYDKAKYPDIFRDAGIELPAEIDWLADWSAGGDPAEVRRWIRDGLPCTGYPGLAAFAARHPRFIVKDAAESGGRNMRVFQMREASGGHDPAALDDAAAFVQQIARRHNVAIQEMIHGSPENWATEDFMRDFVRRQILEWGRGLDRRREPALPIYGSLRVIVSTDDPMSEEPARKWQLSHWISLNSCHPITNVGRGGTLEQLLPEFIRPECREPLRTRIAEAAFRAAEALTRYEDRAAETYQHETGRPVGRDLLGVSYGRPRYLMLDFLVEPYFEHGASSAVLRARYDAVGNRIGAEFVVPMNGRACIVVPSDWRVVLIEPNIGVGLWDRVALREAVHENRRAALNRREPDWNRIGENARIVMRDLHRAGEDYLLKLRDLHA